MQSAASPAPKNPTHRSAGSNAKKNASLKPKRSIQKSKTTFSKSSVKKPQLNKNLALKTKSAKVSTQSVKKQKPNKKQKAKARAKTQQPVVKKPRLIVIDPGHGGLDKGACVKECTEKMLCLMTALMLKKELNEKGFRVLLTRTSDIFIPLKKRTTIANSAKCDLFISLHFNSAPSASANGVEVFIPRYSSSIRKTNSKSIAEKITRRCKAIMKSNCRGVKEANFTVLRETSMPAMLVEGGFITNDKERKKLLNPVYLQSLSKAVAEGVALHFKK